MGERNIRNGLGRRTVSDGSGHGDSRLVDYRETSKGEYRSIPDKLQAVDATGSVDLSTQGEGGGAE